MFGKKADKISKESISTIIGPDVSVEGSIKAQHAVRVDGTVCGDVSTKESLVVGFGAQIFGNIEAANVLNAGEIRGDVKAPKGRVELSDTGKVVGDITAGTLIIDENAVFNGKCAMPEGNDTEASVRDTPAKPEPAKEQEGAESAAEEKGDETSAETPTEDKASEEPLKWDEN